jgi:molybdenum cofactor cytidylyltransferase
MNETLQPRIVGILLAAGAGSRFGSGVNSGGGKLLHPLDGVAIGVRAARNMLAAGLAVTAVVRPGSDELRRLLEDAGCAVTVCADAAEGMGVSLAHVIAQTSLHANEASGWVVALADMPRIRPETIQSVADAVRAGASLAAPSYHGERGHPVGFGAALRDELLACHGDEGARSVVKRHHTEIQLVPVDDPGVVFDIDRKEDVPATL